MEAFATVADIEARWKDLDSTEEARATALLMDASAMLSSQLGDVEIEEGSTLDYALTAVCANMVIRAMSASASDLYGVTQSAMTAGPYTQSMSYANPTGDLYITKAEKAMLGIGEGYITSIQARIGESDD